jgi:hypothetical protein
VVRLALLAIIAVLAAAPAASASDLRAEHRCAKGSKHVIYKSRHKCLTVGQRKQIFWELVRYQDRNPGQDERAYVVIAKQWQIPVKAAYAIAYEGASKNWPMPPPP